MALSTLFAKPWKSCSSSLALFFESHSFSRAPCFCITVNPRKFCVNLVNSDPIDDDPEPTLAREGRVHEESLHLVRNQFLPIWKLWSVIIWPRIDDIWYVTHGQDISKPVKRGYEPFWGAVLSLLSHLQSLESVITFTSAWHWPSTTIFTVVFS